MRLSLRDLLIGTPRLQHRINTEVEQLHRDLAAVRHDSQQLRDGIAVAATSLPALAGAAAVGFVATKIAHRQRSHPAEADAPHVATPLSQSLLWQLLTPLAISWIQTKFAPENYAENTEQKPAN